MRFGMAKGLFNATYGARKVGAASAARSARRVVTPRGISSYIPKGRKPVVRPTSSGISGTRKSTIMAGKGKYLAGAVVAGGVVGGISRKTRGADKARGRPTGVYGY